MRWELGYFQTPMFIKEPGKAPSKPYMLVCVDIASRCILGSDLLPDLPLPQDFLSVIVTSMESPLVGSGAPARPDSVQLNDPAALELLAKELAPLKLNLELVEGLAALEEFKKIAEREFFSQQPGYSGREN